MTENDSPHGLSNSQTIHRSPFERATLIFVAKASAGEYISWFVGPGRSTSALSPSANSLSVESRIFHRRLNAAAFPRLLIRPPSFSSYGTASGIAPRSEACRETADDSAAAFADFMAA